MRPSRGAVNGFWRAVSTVETYSVIHLGTGEDPSRFASSTLTGAPFYERGCSKGGDGPPRAAAAAPSGGWMKTDPFKGKEGNFVRNRKKTTLSESSGMSGGASGASPTV